MIVLNNLPNVLMLNGKNTKDDDDEEDEYEDNEEGDREGEYDENNRNNNHLYPQMEKIEEDKNSNYVSENNNEINENKKKDNNINDEEINEEKLNEIDKKEEEIKNKLKALDSKNLEINAEGGFKPNMLLINKITTDNNLELNSNKNINKNNNAINDNDINNNQKIEKERESIYDLNNNGINEKKKNFIIDITDEELDSLKENKYSENSDFVPFIKEFCDFVNNNETNSDTENLRKNYFEKIKSVEKKKADIPNYYYFYLLYKKKLKIIQQMFNELIPYIINKFPEFNILEKLFNHLLSSIKDSKDLFITLHSNIEKYKEKKNNDDNMNEIIKEKENKISDLEKLKINLLKNIEDNKVEYEKKLKNLEQENKMMTERLITKANDMVNSTIIDTQTSIFPNEKFMTKENNSELRSLNNTKNKKNGLNNEILNTNFSNQYIPTNKSKSPKKLFEYNNTTENINTNNQFNTNTNINTSRQQLISLKSLKDFINELYESKFQYDIKCTKFKLPKETLEEHMYTFLNKKYGLKNLIIEWAKNIITGIKYYSKKDSFVLLFGKIMRNEQEEDARFVIQKVSESIEELLLYYIKRQNPLKLINEIKKMFEKKKKSELYEEEWKGIIYSIYEKEEAKEIEDKIINFINKEIQRKKIEMFKKYKNSRLNNNYQYKYNNTENNYLNTFNSNNSLKINTYMNTNGNFNSNNNKLSRGEKYNMLLFSEDKNILYEDFIKFVLDNHIRFRDKQLKNFVEIFKSVDTNRDGVINEEEFTELIQRMKIFKEDEVENKIFQFLEKIDPFDNQKFTFSECVSFFSSEMIKDENEHEISILEKVCLNKDKNKDENIQKEDENEENKLNDEIIDSVIEQNNNINRDIKNNIE